MSESVTPVPAAPARRSRKSAPLAFPAAPVVRTAERVIEVKMIEYSWGSVEVPDLTAYATRVPSTAVTDFIAWLQAATGLTFSEGEKRAAYLAAFGLRNRWQELARTARGRTPE